MKKCPRCNISLVRFQFSGVNVNQCGKCQGNLIQPDRLNRLVASHQRSAKQLIDAWRSYLPIDTTGKCRCPQCRTFMEKQAKKGGIKLDHFHCRNCQEIWLDPGELELYLLGYLVSEKGKEAQRWKQIHQDMTVAEKAELQRLIDALPVETPPPSNSWNQ